MLKTRFSFSERTDMSEPPNDNAPPTGASNPISPEETAAIGDVPALYANRLFISFMGPVARVSFGDQVDVGLTPNIHTSVILDINNLLQLRDLITALTQDVQTFGVKVPPNG